MDFAKFSKKLETHFTVVGHEETGGQTLWAAVLRRSPRGLQGKAAGNTDIREEVPAWVQQPRSTAGCPRGTYKITVSILSVQ